MKNSEKLKFVFNKLRYFVGGLYLGVINSVNEGILVVIIICMISFFSADANGKTISQNSILKFFRKYNLGQGKYHLGYEMEHDHVLFRCNLKYSNPPLEVETINLTPLASTRSLKRPDSDHSFPNLDSTFI